MKKDELALYLDDTCSWTETWIVDLALECKAKGFIPFTQHPA